MVMSVIKLQRQPVEPFFYSDGFRNIVENHLQMLKNTASQQAIEITARDEIKFRGDFYGLLEEMNVRPEHWWVTLRLNGLTSPMDYQGNMLTVTIPDSTKLEFLLRRYLNSSARV